MKAQATQLHEGWAKQGLPTFHCPNFFNVENSSMIWLSVIVVYRYESSWKERVGWDLFQRQ